MGAGTRVCILVTLLYIEEKIANLFILLVDHVVFYWVPNSKVWHSLFLFLCWDFRPKGRLARKWFL